MKFEDAKPGMIVRSVRPIADNGIGLHAVAYLREQKNMNVVHGTPEPAWFGFWITPQNGGINWPYYANWENWEPVEL